jgi:hypothetical protein
MLAAIMLNVIVLSVMAPYLKLWAYYNISQ